MNEIPGHVGHSHHLVPSGPHRRPERRQGSTSVAAIGTLAGLLAFGVRSASIAAGEYAQGTSAPLSMAPRRSTLYVASEGLPLSQPRSVSNTVVSEIVGGTHLPTDQIFPAGTWAAVLTMVGVANNPRRCRRVLPSRWHRRNHCRFGSLVPGSLGSPRKVAQVVVDSYQPRQHRCPLIPARTIGVEVGGGVLLGMAGTVECIGSED